MDDQTFIFADMSGFTALTEAHGDEAADEHVKSIGDALMIRCDEAGEAIKLGIEVVHEVGGQHHFPTVRVGMATERSGDWFGSTVNVGARVAGEASGGEALLTEATRSAVAPEQFSFHARGRAQLRNVSEPVLLVAALRRGIASTLELPTDPVCQMVVDPESAAGSLRHQGVVYVFCSLECAGRFTDDPDRFASRGAVPSPDGSARAIQRPRASC